MNFRNSGSGLGLGSGFGWGHALAVVALAGIANLPALALDSDKNQPATLEADDFELDLATGVRTYRGGVVFRQGSIHLDCDKLVTYYGEDEKLEKGVCTGNPGRFKQRPEGRDDVHGRARSITLDRVRGVVILENRAAVEQGGNRILGRLITYDLATRKAKVASGEAAEATQKTEPAAANGSANETADRPRLIIQPPTEQPD